MTNQNARRVLAILYIYIFYKEYTGPLSVCKRRVSVKSLKVQHSLIRCNDGKATMGTALDEGNFRVSRRVAKNKCFKGAQSRYPELF